MIGVELQVFWLSEEDYSAQNAGVEVELEECLLKRHTFYSIDYIRPYRNNYCELSSGNADFIINESYESVKKKLDRTSFTSQN